MCERKKYWGRESLCVQRGAKLIWAGVKRETTGQQYSTETTWPETVKASQWRATAGCGVWDTRWPSSYWHYHYLQCLRLERQLSKFRKLSLQVTKKIYIYSCSISLGHSVTISRRLEANSSRHKSLVSLGRLSGQTMMISRQFLWSQFLIWPTNMSLSIVKGTWGRGGECSDETTSMASGPTLAAVAYNYLRVRNLLVALFVFQLIPHLGRVWLVAEVGDIKFKRVM